MTRSWQNDPTYYGMTMSELVVTRYGMSPDEARGAVADALPHV